MLVLKKCGNLKVRQTVFLFSSFVKKLQKEK